MSVSTWRCAYCHDAVGAAPTLRCTGCRTVLHAACLAEAGRCPTLGCARPPCRQVDRPLTPLGSKALSLFMGLWRL